MSKIDEMTIGEAKELANLFSKTTTDKAEATYVKFIED